MKSFSIIIFEAITCKSSSFFETEAPMLGFVNIYTLLSEEADNE